MSIRRKVLTVSDLHQRASLFEQLQVAVIKEQPDVLACVGDTLDGSDPLPDGCLRAEEVALLLVDLQCEVVFSRGNHDSFRWSSFEMAWSATGRPLHALHGTAVTLGPLVIVGFPCVMGDDAAYSEGRRLADYAYEEWLPPLLAQVGPAGRTLWLVHEPTDHGLAAPWACEMSWRGAIDDYQPRIVVSGHDHDTPQSTGIWNVSAGSSILINAGQRVEPQPGKLIYCVVEFLFPKEAASLPQSFAFRMGS